MNLFPALEISGRVDAAAGRIAVVLSGWAGFGEGADTERRITAF